MKTPLAILMGLFLAIIAGCSNPQSTKIKTDVVGIWQNVANNATAIEFTNAGEYYLRVSGARVEPIGPENPVVSTYTYDSIVSGINLKIFDGLQKASTQGTLVFLDPDRIQISLIRNDTVISKSEYTRVKPT